MNKYFEVVKEFLDENNDVVDFVVEEGGFKSYEDALEYINQKKWDLEDGEQIAIWDSNEGGDVNDSWIIIRG